MLADGASQRGRQYLWQVCWCLGEFVSISGVLEISQVYCKYRRDDGGISGRLGVSQVC